jgi:hypothetical protein
MSRYPYLHMKTTVTNLSHRVTFGHLAHVWMTVAHDIPPAARDPSCKSSLKFPNIDKYRNVHGHTSIKVR